VHANHFGLIPAISAQFTLEENERFVAVLVRTMQFASDFRQHSKIFDPCFLFGLVHGEMSTQ